MYARHLCEKAGVKFVLGQPQGELEHLIVNGSGASKKVTGIKTCDGRSHSADLVVVACEYCTASRVCMVLISVPRRSLVINCSSGSASLR